MNDLNLEELLSKVAPENIHDELFKDMPVKISVCKCKQCCSKKKKMQDRRAVRFFKRQTNKKRRKQHNKHVHFTWT